MKYDLIGIWEVLQSWFQTFVDFLITALPYSPVSAYLVYIQDFPYLGYLNWFIPIGACVQIFKVWAVCVSGYYLSSIILRWIKAVS